MQSILQSSNIPILPTRPSVGNTYYRKNVSPNTTKTLVNPYSSGLLRRPSEYALPHSFRESMFVRVIPTRSCASCNGAK